MVQAKLPPADGQTCVDCGQRAFHYDHRYYSRPLDVVPVCRTCNHLRGPARDLAYVIQHGIDYAPAYQPKLARQVAEASISLSSELEEAEKTAIEKALEVHIGNQTRAARSLGMSFRQIRYKIKKFGINIPLRRRRLLVKTQ